MLFSDGDEPDADMVAQVLGVTEEELPLVLANPAETLVNTASRLLEETDLTTVFSQIPPDAFNDLFASKFRKNFLIYCFLIYYKIICFKLIVMECMSQRVKKQKNLNEP